MTPLQKGDRAIVYEDTVTRTRIEGSAVVIGVRGHNVYDVRFDLKHFDVMQVRVIHQPWAVCAWCKSFINERGELIRGCEPLEYECAHDHGICLACKREQLNTNTKGTVNETETSHT